MTENTPFLTPEGKRKLEEELEILRTVGRRQVANNLRIAIEEGDLRENAGYTESKRQQALLEGRIQEMQTLLKYAQPLKGNGRGEVVSLGSQVTVFEQEHGTETYTIVGAAETDPSDGRISNESPLGKAILGHRVGDQVTVKAPSGIVQYEIRALR